VRQQRLINFSSAQIKFEFKVGGGDECAVAAGIYQCGKEKAPEVLKAIQTTLTKNETVAGVRFNLIKVLFTEKNIYLGYRFIAVCSKRSPLLQVRELAMRC